MPEIDFLMGVTTSIGSLPHREPEAACRFVVGRQPRLPAVPQLPNRSRLERRLAQAAWGIPGVSVLDDGSLEIDRGAIDPEAPFTDDQFTGEPYTTLRVFVDSVSDRDGPIKVQLTGPVTLGAALLETGVPAELAFAMARTAILTRARALLAYLGARAPNALPVVFVDEPVLRSCMEPDFPLAPEDAIDMVSGTLAALEPCALTGLRCGGAADWRLVLGSGPQILSVPLDAGIEASAGALDQFLGRGGWVAWGAVPNDGPMGTSTDRLWRKLAGTWCDLVKAGCDPVRIRRQAIITPAGGLGRHSVSQATQVFDITAELAERLHDQAVGVQLTVGA